MLCEILEEAYPIINFIARRDALGSGVFLVIGPWPASNVRQPSQCKLIHFPLCRIRMANHTG